MLHLLVDTSTWLDLSKRRDGRRWILALQELVRQGDVELMVPQIVIDEYERNRERIETSMTSSVAQRFKAIKQDLDDYGADADAAKVVDDLARHAPLIGAMTTRNFDDVLALLKGGRRLEPTEAEQLKVVARGLAKQAPFHRSRNSVADALLVELYSTAARGASNDDPYAFVTTNSEDFSSPTGDKREPHPDLAELFAGTHSSYWLRVDGLNDVLLASFGDEIRELFADSEFDEEPRRLGDILAAEHQMFDRVWYHRSLQSEYRLKTDGDKKQLAYLRKVAGPARARVESTYTEAGQLGPYSDFELGMLNGKLSALRWVLGSEWDFLDT
ncbi:MAG: PIN domain-containing protein [Thermomicrobiales bacterium]